jgi:5,10-methenyltetrahydrofolate synthetase
MNLSLANQKATLRKLMKETLKQLSVEEKERQSSVLTRHFLHTSEAFRNAKHIALYLAMRHEEIDTIPLIESLLENKDHYQKHVYVPHVPMSSQTDSSRPQMVFYELKSIDQYHNEMNDNNKFKLRQFNRVEHLSQADPNRFDLAIVPGLAFDTAGKRISRLGRGKGYYDVFLSSMPKCHTIGIGFNQQFLPLSENLNSTKLPFDEARDVCLNEFVCEKLI